MTTQSIDRIMKGQSGVQNAWHNFRGRASKTCDSNVNMLMVFASQRSVGQAVRRSNAHVRQTPKVREILVIPNVVGQLQGN